MLIVQACEFITDGDGYYRMHEPMRHLGRLSGVTAIDCHIHHRLFTDLSEICDVLVLPFFYGGEFFSLIERRRKNSKVTVFETNDYFADIQAWNSIAPHWYDPDVQFAHRAYIEICDAVQTSTERLKLHWQELARTMAAFPNQLSTIPPLANHEPRPFTVGWAGSQGHLADWLELAPHLESWLSQHSDVHLAVMSHRLAPEFIKIPKERFRFREAATLNDYYQFLAGLDVGFAPLLPSEYNRCRSDVKFLEYAAHGVVGIYTDLEPYRDSVKHGVTGFVSHTPVVMMNYLDKLYLDRSLLKQVRVNAHAYVTNERQFPMHIGKRLEFYSDLLPNPQVNAEAQSILNEVKRLAIADQNYFRLEPGEMERKVMSLVDGKPSADTVAGLRAVLQMEPRYHFAQHMLGKVLNDLKLAVEATPALEKAMELAQGSKTLSELGRSYFLRGDTIKARQYLEQAVTVSPYDASAWSYFLNFMRIAPQPDQADIIGRVLELHSHSVRLRLLVAKLLPAEEALSEVQTILEGCLNTLSQSELENISAEFIGTLISFDVSILTKDHGLSVLNQASKAFPYSAKLFELLGRVQMLRSDLKSAGHSFAEALKLSKTQKHFVGEYTPGSDNEIYWKVVEHLGRYSN